MKLSRIACLAAVPAALAGLVAAPSLAEPQPPADVGTDVAAPQTEGEAQLAKLLEGRVAGEPVQCIRTLPNQSMRTITGTAYVYGVGDTIYVQRTQNPETIRQNDALVTNRFSATQLCRMDITTKVDRFNGIFSGVVIMEDFVPYKRAGSRGKAEG